MKPLVLQVQLDLTPLAAAALMRIAEALAPVRLAAPVRTRRPWRLRTAPTGAVADDPPVPPTLVAAEPDATPAPAAIATLVPAPRTGPRWSEERCAIIRARYPVGHPRADIVDAINALPGPPVTAMLVSATAARLGVRRPPTDVPVASAPDAPVTTAAVAAVPDPPLATEETEAVRAQPIEPPLRAVPPPSSPPPSIRVDQAAVQADYATVEAWAGPRGLASTRERLDLARVNRKRIELGQPPFELVRGSSTGRGNAA